MPCFNDGPTVREAVASARAQGGCELVVVDDGSVDAGTIVALAELEADGIAVIRQLNRGSSAARMAGVAATSGRYVVPLDADDRLLPGALQAMADYLDTHADVAAVWGDIQLAGSLDHLRRTARTLDPWLVTFWNDHPGPGSMVRRDVLLEVGGWRAPKPAMPNCYWDWNFWMALAEHGKPGAHVGVTTLQYRVEQGRVNQGCRSRHAELYEALRVAHPRLFAARRANRRNSPAPTFVRAGILAIEAVPGLPRLTRGRLAAGICQLAYRRGGYLRPIRRRF